VKGSEVSVSDFAWYKSRELLAGEWINLGSIFPNIRLTNQQDYSGVCVEKVPRQVRPFPLSKSLLCTTLVGIDSTHIPRPFVYYSQSSVFLIIVGCIPCTRQQCYNHHPQNLAES